MNKPQIESLITPTQLEILRQSKPLLSILSSNLDDLLNGATPSDAAFVMLETHKLVDWNQLLRILESLKYPTATGYGPTGCARCPKCDNSLQNGVPSDAPYFRRCADCKTVFKLPTAEVLSKTVHASLEKSKGESLTAQQVIQILNNLRLGDHPDDSTVEKFITDSTVWLSVLRPWCLQWHPKSYREYIQDFLNGELKVEHYNFCIEQVSGQTYVWSYIMGSGAEQMLTRRLFPDEESLMKCYNAIGVESVRYGVG